MSESAMDIRNISEDEIDEVNGAIGLAIGIGVGLFVVGCLIIGAMGAHNEANEEKAK